MKISRWDQPLQKWTQQKLFIIHHARSWEYWEIVSFLEKKEEKKNIHQEDKLVKRELLQNGIMG